MKTHDDIKKEKYLYNPEEIKEIMQSKGYIYSQEKLYRSTLALIQQLEADVKIAEIKMNAAFAKCEQLERERDAAVADLATIHKCEPCKHRTSNSYISNECFDCVNFCNFEWRGPCEENS